MQPIGDPVKRRIASRVHTLVILDRSEAANHLAKQPLAQGRQSDPAGLADEHCGSDPVLQGPDLVADGRGRDAQLFGSLTNALMASCDDEGVQRDEPGSVWSGHADS